jgi:hypothetical protein
MSPAPDHLPDQFVTPDAAFNTRERRQQDRIVSGASAIARIPASPHRVTLIDVSRTGCQIRLNDGIAVPVGATVHLDFGPGRHMTGQVMWSGPRTAGVQFDRAVSGPIASALGIESTAMIEVDAAPPPATELPERAIRMPHWLRRILGGAS